MRFHICSVTWPNAHTLAYWSFPKREAVTWEITAWMVLDQPERSKPVRSVSSCKYPMSDLCTKELQYDFPFQAGSKHAFVSLLFCSCNPRPRNFRWDTHTSYISSLASFDQPKDGLNMTSSDWQSDRRLTRKLNQRWKQRTKAENICYDDS